MMALERQRTRDPTPGREPMPDPQHMGQRLVEGAAHMSPSRNGLVSGGRVPAMAQTWTMASGAAALLDKGVVALRAAIATVLLGSPTAETPDLAGLPRRC